VAAIFDDQILDYIGSRAGIDANPAHVYTACLARTEFVKFQNVSALNQHHISDRAMHRARHLRVQLQLPVLAVNGNEVFRLHQIDNKLKFLLASVSAYVDGRRRSVFVDYVRLAAEQMVNHAVDRLLVAGNDS